MLLYYILEAYSEVIVNDHAAVCILTCQMTAHADHRYVFDLLNAAQG